MLDRRSSLSQCLIRIFHPGPHRGSAAGFNAADPADNRLFVLCRGHRHQPVTGTVKNHHTNQILTTQQTHRRRRRDLGHLQFITGHGAAAVHDQHQRAFGHLLFLRRVQLHRQNLGHRRTNPAAGPECLRAAHHNQTAAQIGDKSTQHPLLFHAERAAIRIHQDDCIRIHQPGQAVGHIGNRHIMGLNLAVLQHCGQRRAGLTVAVHHNQLPRTGHIG